MAKVLRTIASAIGKRLNVNIVRDGGVALLFERVHLKRFLESFEVDCVFDVGANEGQYAEQLRSLGYRGAIVSFEPIPKLAADLRRKAARDPGWFIEQVALDEVARDATFNVMARSSFSSLKRPSEAETQIFVDLNTVAQAVAIRTDTLAPFFDKYVSKLRFKRPYLKMDTQGNDIAVARGAGDRLQMFVGLQSELAIKKIYEGTTDFRESIDFFISMGFELSAFVPNNQGHFPTLVEIDCIMINRNELGNDRLASPLRR